MYICLDLILVFLQMHIYNSILSMKNGFDFSIPSNTYRFTDLYSYESIITVANISLTLTWP